MKLAVSIFKESISTVFDAADQLLMIEMAPDGSRQRSLLKISSSEPASRAFELKALGVDVLICGAISRHMQASMASQGIEVHAFVRGTVDDVVAAYSDNRLGQSIFSLPGCHGREPGNSFCAGPGSKAMRGWGRGLRCKQGSQRGRA